MHGIKQLCQDGFLRSLFVNIATLLKIIQPKLLQNILILFHHFEFNSRKNTSNRLFCIKKDCF